MEDVRIQELTGLEHGFRSNLMDKLAELEALVEGISGTLEGLYDKLPYSTDERGDSWPETSDYAKQLQRDRDQVLDLQGTIKDLSDELSDLFTGNMDNLTMDPVNNTESGEGPSA